MGNWDSAKNEKLRRVELMDQRQLDLDRMREAVLKLELIQYAKAETKLAKEDLRDYLRSETVNQQNEIRRDRGKLTKYLALGFTLLVGGDIWAITEFRARGERVLQAEIERQRHVATNVMATEISKMQTQVRERLNHEFDTPHLLNDIQSAVSRGRSEIGQAIRAGVRDIAQVREAATGLNGQLTQLQSDIDRYRRVNTDLGRLQKQFDDIQGQVVDLGKRTLMANALKTTGSQPGSVAFGRIGCSPTALEDGEMVAYCAQGSPLVLFQMTRAGELRPVSSLSSVGFQDASNAPKPTCLPAVRGTIYVEKGTGAAPDKAYLCSKAQGNSYAWMQFGMLPAQ